MSSNPTPRGRVDSSFEKIENRRDSALFKLRSSVKAIISISKQKKLAFVKKKMEWGRQSGKHDAISDQIFSTLTIDRDKHPLPSPPAQQYDSREVFYAHNVKAEKELCMSCYDALLYNIKSNELDAARAKRRASTQKQREKMIKLAGCTIADTLDDSSDDETSSTVRSLMNTRLHPNFANLTAPIFITWSKLGEVEEDTFVRGKAGTMAPITLGSELPKLAIDAGSFANELNYFPIRRNELDRLNCFIEIPNTYSSIYNLGDWIPGVHGLSIRFTDSIGSIFSGQIMPVDTSDVNLTQDDVMKMLVSKAGYKGSVTRSMILEAAFMRFETTKISLTWGEYRDFARKRKVQKKVDAINRKIRKAKEKEAEALRQAKEEKKRKKKEAKKEKKRKEEEEKKLQTEAAAEEKKKKKAEAKLKNETSLQKLKRMKAENKT
ncbi:hypothetical protein TL16_g09783 [Triparma laevis f. inornata]|uniref:AMMECR1 domain-containing protein n=1 Tax=Triparma laevis f. inornata TaxID=1714386 RepID=A0A9W7EKB1_9STRA|nr:hypothetical protein TL16_g09783 [Triparma laevis f. inornata]